MKTVLAFVALLAFLNAVLFIASKLFGLLEPYIFRAIERIFKVKGLAEVLQDPEIKEKDRVRSTYRVYFWNLWFIFWYALSPMTGIHFYVALATGLVLHLVGYSEAGAVGRITARYQRQQYLETLAAQDFTMVEQFLTELKKQIEAAQGKKDVERN